MKEDNLNKWKTMQRDNLDKFFQTPGLCSKQELEFGKYYLESFKEMKDIYFSVLGIFPAGFTLEANLDTVNWYLLRK